MTVDCGIGDADIVPPSLGRGGGNARVGHKPAVIGGQVFLGRLQAGDGGQIREVGALPHNEARLGGVDRVTDHADARPPKEANCGDHDHELEVGEDRGADGDVARLLRFAGHEL